MCNLKAISIRSTDLRNLQQLRSNITVRHSDGI